MKPRWILIDASLRRHDRHWTRLAFNRKQRDRKICETVRAIGLARLPPIHLHRTKAGVYFVVDGNHRLHVAIEDGAGGIWAIIENE